MSKYPTLEAAIEAAPSAEIVVRTVTPDGNHYRWEPCANWGTARLIKASEGGHILTTQICSCSLWHVVKE